MQVLLTNDDGIEAEGLQAMRRALVAGAGHRAGGHRARRQPLGLRPHDHHAPAAVGAGGALRGRHAAASPPTARRSTACAWPSSGLIEGFDADIVVAGINHGSNLGDDITYSGTVAAALEALVLGIPGIAVSQQSNAREMDFRLGSRFAFERAADFVARVVAELDEVPLPAGHAAEHQRPRGRARRASRSRAWASASTATSSSSTPRTRTAAGATGSTAPTPASTTSRAPTSPPCTRGHIAVTPVHFDLTDVSGLDALTKYDLARLLAPAAREVQ